MSYDSFIDMQGTSNFNRAMIYAEENKRNPMDAEEVFQHLSELTIDAVAKMTVKELSAYFPKYDSGEFRPLQHVGIWNKLLSLEKGIREKQRNGDCLDYYEKDRILSGIRYDREHV